MSAKKNTKGVEKSKLFSFDALSRADDSGKTQACAITLVIDPPYQAPQDTHAVGEEKHHGGRNRDREQ